jgi:hypothetical protein
MLLVFGVPCITHPVAETFVYVTFWDRVGWSSSISQMVGIGGIRVIVVLTTRGSRRTTFGRTVQQFSIPVEPATFERGFEFLSDLLVGNEFKVPNSI